MYYFVENKDIVEKYLVSFDRQEIEKLKIKIINNCSKIVHHEYDGTHGPNQFDYLKIRNYKERFIRIQESRDTLQYPDQKIYHYSYDEYKFPVLVSYINELLIKENVLILDKIFNENDEIKTETYDDKIKKASDELDAVNNLDIDKKRAKLDELQELLKLKKLNEKQESIDLYVDELKRLITFDLVDTISKIEIDRVNNFFENKADLKKQTNKKLVKGR